MNEKNQLYLELLNSLLGRLESHIKFFQSDDYEYSGLMPKLEEALIMTSKFVLKENSLRSKLPL